MDGAESAGMPRVAYRVLLLRVKKKNHALQTRKTEAPKYLSNTPTNKCLLVTIIRLFRGRSRRGMRKWGCRRQGSRMERERLS